MAKRRNRRIKISYNIVTPESAEKGDVAKLGWISKSGVSMELEDWEVVEIKEALIKGYTDVPSIDEEVIENTIKYLKGEGIIWGDGTTYNTEGVMDTYGEAETRYYHLRGYTKEELNIIYDNLKKLF